MNIIETIELTKRAFMPEAETLLIIIWAIGILGGVGVICYLCSKAKNIFLCGMTIIVGMLAVSTALLVITAKYGSAFVYNAPTGEIEYHVQLTDMTPEELAQKYQIITYENDYWVIRDKTE